MSTYRMHVSVGDRVRMPDGRVGTIVGFDFPLAPNFLRVHVRPDRPSKGWRKFLPVFNRQFIEEEIDQLERIATHAERTHT